jgi:hypothetical protein
MLTITIAIAFASLLSAQPDGSANDDAAAWSRAHPREMFVFQSWDGDASVYTPAFRACVDTGLKAGYRTADIVASCLRQARLAQAEEEGKKAREKNQAETEMRRRQYQEKVQKEADDSKARSEARQRDYDANHPEAVKRWLGAVIGYCVAVLEDRRSDAVTEIAKQKKYAKVGGVLNKGAISEQQDRIRVADEAIEENKSYAKGNGVKVLPRTDKRVAAVEDCLEASYDHSLYNAINQSDIERMINGASSFALDGQDCLWIAALLKETDQK